MTLVWHIYFTHFLYYMVNIVYVYGVYLLICVLTMMMNDDDKYYHVD